MCGIHVTLSAKHRSIPSELRSCLSNRGPDHVGEVQRRVRRSNDASPYLLTFTSTVLALRGDHIAKQPLAFGGNGSVLCWNGEAWRIGGRRVQGNDGEDILGLLAEASASAAGQDAILDVFRRIEGPFAFVYYDEPSGTVFFGRDRLGRRSLMISEDASGDLTLCSVAESREPIWREVEADGFYSLDPSQTSSTEPASRLFRKHEWLKGDGPEWVSGIGKFNRSLPPAGSVLSISSPSVVLLRERLVDSLRLRVLDIPQPPLSTSTSPRVAVLFSGGLDCTVLARLAHEVLEPDQGIDLINVAFENPRVVAQLQKESVTDFYEACPDRITGRKSFAELVSVCPGRGFRFIAVNIPYTETISHREQVISLIYPHNTEMDLSIAYALYFASRGQGLASLPDGVVELAYKTPARVLLSGLGADELFGGYGRHAVAYSRKGYPGLVDELLLDVSRISKRNLGRDDRVMAHWGKEVRFPYLDERLVRWAMEACVWEKCDFENGDAITGVEAGKRVLRLLALQLGMSGVATEKKRAIQFGSRTAKMESGRVKGTTVLS
ncbi:asparagine synthetase [Echria macrotheca]|uniref:Asparagine synthetase n=1 Tax=Echria macrotheca TaxID=438768 RepID=A0AAJ0BCN3_9PEZI|nr:asparagine synthetase [Echria macrotheca]